MADLDTSTDVGTDIALRIARALEAAEGRARLAEQLRARTPAYIEEYQNLASGTQITLTPKTSQPFLVEAIVASVPASANLQLGDRVIYLPQAGLFVMAPLQVLLVAGDIRLLTASSAGAMSLNLTGHQLPQWGTLR